MSKSGSPDVIGVIRVRLEDEESSLLRLPTFKVIGNVAAVDDAPRTRLSVGKLLTVAVTMSSDSFVLSADEFSSANMVLITATSVGFALAKMPAGATVEKKRLINVGENALDIGHLLGGSEAGRISTSSGDSVEVLSGGSVTVVWDNVDELWRVNGTEGGGE